MESEEWNKLRLNLEFHGDRFVINNHYRPPNKLLMHSHKKPRPSTHTNLCEFCLSWWLTFGPVSSLVDPNQQLALIRQAKVNSIPEPKWDAWQVTTIVICVPIIRWNYAYYVAHRSVKMSLTVLIELRYPLFWLWFTHSSLLHVLGWQQTLHAHNAMNVT